MLTLQEVVIAKSASPSGASFSVSTLTSEFAVASCEAPIGENATIAAVDAIPASIFARSFRLFIPATKGLPLNNNANAFHSPLTDKMLEEKEAHPLIAKNSQYQITAEILAVIDARKFELNQRRFDQ